VLLRVRELWASGSVRGLEKQNPRPGREGRGLCSHNNEVGRLATHSRLVGVRVALGQNRCARGCKKSKSEQGGFHFKSPNQCPVCNIAVGRVLIRR